MQNVYPKASEAAPFQPIDSEAACAQRIIQAMDSGLSKAQAVGPALDGSDDVTLFYRLWDEITEEGKRYRAINPNDHNTLSKYKEALDTVGEYLDPTAFYEGLKAEKSVTSFADLQNACKVTVEKL